MTAIQWTDETWNPIVGCSRISPGCQRCYAAAAAKSARLQQFPQYQKVKEWDGSVEFVKNQLLKPLSWKNPKRIFVCSMSDLFHENVPFEWIDQVCGIAAMCPQHTFQILTKRPQRAKEYFEDRANNLDTFISTSNLSMKHVVARLPLPNVWFGVTCENQAMADERIPLLLQIPAAIRFLSCEPLLGEIDLSQWLYADIPGKPRLNQINWCIIGGESGPGARACSIDWMRSLVRQSQEAEIPVFVKQLGSNCCTMPGLAFGYSDRKGGNIAEFPEDLKIRQFPQ